jgi:hypothetical protein
MGTASRRKTSSIALSVATVGPLGAAMDMESVINMENAGTVYQFIA